MPEKLNEAFNLLKAAYKNADIELAIKNNLHGRGEQEILMGNSPPNIHLCNIDWCDAMKAAEEGTTYTISQNINKVIDKDIIPQERAAFIKEYMAKNAERIQKMINEAESKEQMDGLEKLVGIVPNNDLLSFPSREDELNTVFN
jgi:hypothetical protein